MKSIISPLIMAVLCCAMGLAQNNSSNYGTYPGKTTTAQMISNGPVAETVSDSSAFIGWSTKEAESNATVRYGTNRDHLTQTAQTTDNSDGKNHHARLENLSPDTTYYFQITENGEPQGGIGTFRTVGAGDKPIQSKAVIGQK